MTLGILNLKNFTIEFAWLLPDSIAPLLSLFLNEHFLGFLPVLLTAALLHLSLLHAVFVFPGTMIENYLNGD